MKFDYPSVQTIRDNMHGFYRIGHDEYHAGIGISSSSVKKALISRSQYLYRDDSDTAAMAFGRAFHAAILEPELYRTKWVTIDGHPNSNAYKAAKSEALAKGKEVINADDVETVAAMVSAVKSHDEYAAVMGGHAEIMAITTCPETGLLIKCKSDMLSDAILDFKTTSSGLRPHDFMRDIVNWNYHVSAAFYQDIITVISGARLKFIIAPVSKKPPFECEFYQLSDELLEEGRKLYKAGLRQIAKWKKEEKPAPKRIRHLLPSARVLYSTQEILANIEAET